VRRGRGGVEGGREKMNASIWYAWGIRVTIEDMEKDRKSEGALATDHFDSVCSCGKLSESEKIDIWSVSEALVDDGLCAGRSQL
jgi:hypothetical protein